MVHGAIDVEKHGDGDGDGDGEVAEGQGWEIAHLPGVGPYALDSWRIFGRDALFGRGRGRGHAAQDRDQAGESDITATEEEEWQRVVPADKDLRAWLIWRWRRAGWQYDVFSGKRTRIVIEEEKKKEEEEGEEDLMKE